MGKIMGGTLILWMMVPVLSFALMDTYSAESFNWPFVIGGLVAAFVLMAVGLEGLIKDCPDQDYERRKNVCGLVVLNSWVPPVGPCLAAVVSGSIGFIAYPLWLVWSIGISWYYSTHFGKRSGQ